MLDEEVHGVGVLRNLNSCFPGHVAAATTRRERAAPSHDSTSLRDKGRGPEKGHNENDKTSVNAHVIVTPKRHDARTETGTGVDNPTRNRLLHYHRSVHSWVYRAVIG